MTEETENLVLEVLRKIQSDIAFLKHDNIEIKSTLGNIRQDIHNVRGDVLRLDRSFASLEMRVERIETRLELRDA